jgi:hypothetical protein
VDDHAGALLQHQREQPTVETNCGEQVAVHRVLPMLVSECGEPSARCRRSSDIVDQNVDPAQAIPHMGDDLLRTLGRAEAGFHEQIRLKHVRGVDRAVVTTLAPEPLSR